MISTKQKWALSGLITLSAAIWTPQIAARLGGDMSAQVDVASGPDEFEMLSVERGSSGTPQMRDLHRGQSTGGDLPSTGPDQGHRAGRLHPPGAASAAPAGSRAIVSEVLRTLRQSEAFGMAEEARAATVAIENGEPVSEPEQAPALLTYLESHPLRGTIVGDTFQLALIGQHRVHLGEIVPGTGAVLVSVERGRVTLEEGEMSIELELKALQTSPALMAERERQIQSMGSGNMGSGNMGSGNMGSGSMVPGSGDLNGTHNLGLAPASNSAANTQRSAGNSTNTAPSGSPGDF